MKTHTHTTQTSLLPYHRPADEMQTQTQTQTQTLQEDGGL